MPERGDDRRRFMRARLSTYTNGLAAIWVRELAGQRCAGPWRMDRLALGYHLGAVLQATIAVNDPQSSRAVFLLGDPTLRAQIVAPPQIQSAVTNWTGTNREVRLTWTASPDAANGYFVYRGTNIENALTNQICWVPSSTTSFTNSPAASGSNIHYLVRAANLTATGGGSFTNLSYATYTIVSNLP